jgi:hypothetical protein
VGWVGGGGRQATGHERGKSGRGGSSAQAGAWVIRGTHTEDGTSSQRGLQSTKHKKNTKSTKSTKSTKRGTIIQWATHKRRELGGEAGSRRAGGGRRGGQRTRTPQQQQQQQHMPHLQQGQQVLLGGGRSARVPVAGAEKEPHLGQLVVLKEKALQGAYGALQQTQLDQNLRHGQTQLVGRQAVAVCRRGEGVCAS